MREDFFDHAEFFNGSDNTSPSSERIREVQMSR
jgi:hypothetical protein